MSYYFFHARDYFRAYFVAKYEQAQIINVKMNNLEKKAKIINEDLKITIKDFYATFTLNIHKYIAVF